MFKAEVNDTKLFKDSLQSVSNLIAEGQLVADEDGIHLTTADASMVVLVDLHIGRDTFNDYEVEGENRIGINLERLYTILKRANSSDTLSLELTDSKLIITLENGSTRTFSLPLLNIDEEDVNVDLDFSAEADFRSSVLSDGIGDASVVGDAVTVSAEEDAVVIQAEGDQSDVEFRIEEGSDGLMDLDVNEPARSMFGLDYLSQVMKAKKLSDTVHVSMGSDIPMRLDFNVPDKLELGFLIAPRIEEE